MKTLYLVRHAKSSWDDPDLDDFDRPLNRRGEKDAPNMGKRLKMSGAAPNTIYSSPAVRALETAKLVADKLDFPQSGIHTDSTLYHAGEKGLLEFIQKVSDKNDSIMIVAHNPGLTEFANSLLDEEINNIPTAGVIQAQLKIEFWKEANWGCGKLQHFDFPKKN